MRLTLLLSYEDDGNGDNDFNNPLAGFERSLLQGSVGVIAYSPKDGYQTSRQMRRVNWAMPVIGNRGAMAL